MMPMTLKEQAPVPPPPYYRAQARLSLALHIDALTLVSTLHLLTPCRLAVHLACSCFGLRLASGKGWPAANPLPLTAMETRTPGRCAAAGGALCAQRAD